MTVTVQTQKVLSPGNGSATSFSFSPMVIFSSSNLTVQKLDISANTYTTLTEGTGSANYAVVVAEYPGTGSLTYPASGGTPMSALYKLVTKRVLTIEQQIHLTNQGGYRPDVQEAGFDRLVMICLQQQEEIDRCVKLAIGDTVTTIEDLTANLQTLAAISSDVSTVAGISANVTKVAGISAAVTRVDGISANVLRVDGISANVSTVAGISANVSSVAGISAAVASVSANSANINTVAAISANVNTVAGISANVNTVAGISASVLAASANAASAALSSSNAATSSANAAASAAAAAAAAGSNLFNRLTDKSANFSATADTDDGCMFKVSTSGNSATMTLPAIATAGEGERYGIYRTVSANTLTLARNGTDTINNVAGNYTVNAVAGELTVIIADSDTPNNWIVFTWTQAQAGDGLSKSGSTISLDRSVEGAWTKPQLATAISANTAAFDLSAKQSFECTPSAAVTITFSNYSARGGLTGHIELINSANYAVTFAAPCYGRTGLAAALSVTGNYIVGFMVNKAASKVYLFDTEAMVSL